MFYKFEGDLNFDYWCFRDTIEKAGVSFYEIQLAECKIVKSVDISVLRDDTVFDFNRFLAARLNVKEKGLIESFARFMDNFSLYCLMTDNYAYSHVIICFVASMAFFKVRNEIAALNCIKSIFFESIQSKICIKRKINEYKDIVVNKLKELGAKESDIMLIERELVICED